MSESVLDKVNLMQLHAVVNTLSVRVKELESENEALRQSAADARNAALEKAARLYDGDEWIGCKESIIAAEIRALKDQQGQRSEAVASGTPKLLDASVQSSDHPAYGSLRDLVDELAEQFKRDEFPRIGQIGALYWFADKQEAK